MRDAAALAITDGLVSPVPMMSGCFMLVRRNAVDATGGFDPGYFLFFEDFDWSVGLNRVTKSPNVPSVRLVLHGDGACRRGWRHVFQLRRVAGPTLQTYVS